ncbi:biphenyl 2,3-dioxygenase [Roseomonas hellenica]|uniref:Biphenyl 2,3-dioxygenase n=1 Tax=Plastoroseomonas hellenica TaxID=2687306 RepID=A0ABS5EZD1_9PROT|nr:VOC family protein [Plastoroseomonas hellenica]MBR0665644.1 biphenyl 2,3-dioxygenase [Plastoroseomonas hellenica]
MAIIALGYMVIGSDRLDAWDGFATGLLGMQRVDRGGGLRAFRMDDRQQRLIVSDSAGPATIGWEVPDATGLDDLAARLEAAGTRVARAPRGIAEERQVADLISFRDPQGTMLEAFHGAVTADRPFIPGRPITGFRTGPLGMGHAVLHVADADALVPFYRDLLGFGVTDWSRTPYPLYFFHVNGRHHSFAMVGSGRTGLHHFMVELGSLDDVGQGHDIARMEEGRLAYGLGRHTNDHMTSFYANTPSGFFVEVGWGARTIDPATWTPHETRDGPSLWGHERFHMPEEARARMRALAMDAAARGIRAPDPNPGPWPSSGCAWADAVITCE